MDVTFVFPRGDEASPPRAVYAQGVELLPEPGSRVTFLPSAYDPERKAHEYRVREWEHLMDGSGIPTGPKGLRIHLDPA